MADIASVAPGSDLPSTGTKSERLWRWARKSQELLAWLPISVGLYYVAWAALGRVADPSDTLVGILNLVQLISYAIAAQGVANLALRRYRRKLSKVEQRELWDAVLKGERGALFILCLDCLVWALCYGVAIWYFWPSR